MAQRVPGTFSQAPYAEVPQPNLVRQIVATPWVTLVLIASSLFLLAMMAFTVWGDRGLLAMWNTRHDLERLAREIEIVEQKMRLWSVKYNGCAAISSTSKKSPAMNSGWCVLARSFSSLQIEV
jgi:hypothetical protein